MAAIVVASHVHCTATAHLMSDKRALRYLNGAACLQMKIKQGPNSQYTAYAEESWVAEAEHGRRSCSGLLIQYPNAAVAAAIEVQKCVTLSSTEATYIALSEHVKTIAWFQNVLSELSFEQELTRVYQDDTGCVLWANGGMSKHLRKGEHIHARRK